MRDPSLRSGCQTRLLHSIKDNFVSHSWKIVFIKSFIDENKISFQINRHMSISKDTLKAIIIIVIALTVLVVLLVVANHLRPHP